jgi:transglutaminase-like putative cysteine protease
MRIKAGYRITYECPSPTPMIALLSVRPERIPDLETPQWMTTDPVLPLQTFTDGFGNIATRLTAPAGRTTLSADFIINDNGQPDEVDLDAIQHPIEFLPDYVLQFLLASRFCEIELLNDLAWSRFGSTPPGWRRVQAIVDYAHDRITFGYEHASPTKTAFRAHDEQRGVCRDYAHLAVTLCRCMNIPARYCTGYLGDIGVDPVDAPMDFSAWFQVFLGGKWRTFDARHNKPRVGRILMAYGRDATDTAITTIFGPSYLAEFTVITDELTS